jgi:hypothetical protein
MQGIIVLPEQTLCSRRNHQHMRTVMLLTLSVSRDWRGPEFVVVEGVQVVIP